MDQYESFTLDDAPMLAKKLSGNSEKLNLSKYDDARVAELLNAIRAEMFKT